MTTKRLYKFIKAMENKTRANKEMSRLELLECGILDFIHNLEVAENDTARLSKFAYRVTLAVANYNKFYTELPHVETKAFAYRLESDELTLEKLLDLLGPASHNRVYTSFVINSILFYVVCLRSEIDELANERIEVYTLIKNIVDKEGLQFLVKNPNLKPDVDILHFIAFVLTEYVYAIVIQLYDKLAQTVRTNLKVNNVIPLFSNLDNKGVMVNLTTGEKLVESGYTYKEDEEWIKPLL